MKSLALAPSIEPAHGVERNLATNGMSRTGRKNHDNCELRPGAVAVDNRSQHEGGEDDGTVVYNVGHAISSASDYIEQQHVVEAELATPQYFDQEELRNQIVQDITGNLVVGAPVGPPGDDSNDTSNAICTIHFSKRVVLAVIVVCLLIIGVVVGVIVGTNSSAATAAPVGLTDMSQRPIVMVIPPTAPPITPRPTPISTISPTTTCRDGPASQIGTPFDTNGEWFGVFFDILVSTNLEVTEMLLHTDSTESTNVRIYSKFGTHVSFERQSIAWNLVADITVIGRGRGAGTPVRLSVPVQANAGDTRAFFTSTNRPTRFMIGTQRGDVVVSNDDIQILEGTVIGCGPSNSFICGADIHHPRVFNGIITYCLL